MKKLTLVVLLLAISANAGVVRYSAKHIKSGAVKVAHVAKKVIY